MSDIEVTENVKKLINGIISKKNIPPIEKLEDYSLTTQLNFDSLDLAELTVRIEDLYDVDIFENDIVDSVDEILKIIKNSKGQ